MSDADEHAPAADNAGGPPVEGRRILLGVSGGIAAYKAALLVRLFKKAGAEVQVLMTPRARHFISPLTLGTLSEREVLTEIFPDAPGQKVESERSPSAGASSRKEGARAGGSWTKHVQLGLWADLFIIAPATAQTIARLAGGFSGSMLTATALSARCPLLVCPSMDRDMYQHPAVQANLQTLERFGYEILPAARGALASGLVGAGRLPEPEAIFEHAANRLAEAEGKAEDEPSERKGDPAGRPHSPPGRPSSKLSGKRVLVTAGPTCEPLDPVRALTNPSTGTMGFCLAEAALQRGAEITLISGPTTLKAAPGIRRIDVTTAAQMHEAVLEHAPAADLVLMAAAVADYTPADPSPSKLKKGTHENPDGTLTLQLRRTPDILADLGRRKADGQRLLGFALETDDGPANARRKLKEKNLDWIVLNSPTEEGAGFGPDTNRAVLITPDSREETLPLMSKRKLADTLLDRITG